jgi:hypothetical protein
MGCIRAVRATERTGVASPTCRTPSPWRPQSRAGKTLTCEAVSVARGEEPWKSQDTCVCVWLAAGQRRLYFKRRMYVIGSDTDLKEDKPESPDDPYHRLAFAESVYSFLECMYRFPAAHALEMAGLLLYIRRGPLDETRDTRDVLESLIEEVVPRYLLSDRTDVKHERVSSTLRQATTGESALSEAEAIQRVAAGAAAGRRWANSLVYRRVGIVEASADGASGGGEGPMTRSEAVGRVRPEYLSHSGSSRFDAEKQFVQRVKEFVAYGSDVYVGKRTWRANDVDATEDEVMERTEDVTICVAYSGVVFTGLQHPLGCEEHKFDSITKWTLSEDSRVFAFQVEEPDSQSDGLFKFVVYVVTDQAPDVEASVDRFVNALVEHSQEKLPSSRPRGDPKFGTVPEIRAHEGAPRGDSEPKEGIDWDARPSVSASASSAAGEAPADEEEAAAAAASEEAPLPPGWVKMYDDDGDAYYFNQETEQTQWEAPAAQESASSSASDLPEGWEARQDEDGDTYYYNSVTEQTQWERPTSPAPTGGEDALPPGWTRMFDDEGDAYYLHEESGVTQWEVPTE